MAGGRPTKYKKKYCEMLIEHSKKGLSFESFASVIEVSRAILYDWVRDHKEFSDAKKTSLEKKTEFYEKIGVKAMVGQLPGFNATAYVWLTKNMLGWRDKIDTTSEVNHKSLDGTMTPKLNLSNVNVSPELFEDLIKLDARITKNKSDH